MNYNEWHSLMVSIILKIIPKWHEKRKTFHAILLLNVCVDERIFWEYYTCICTFYMNTYTYAHPSNFITCWFYVRFFFTGRTRLVTENESFKIILFIIFRLIWVNRRTGVALTRSKQCHEQNNIISHIRW